MRVNVIPEEDDGDGEEDGTADGGRVEEDLSASATITASSILPPDIATVNYVPLNLIDNDFETCWAEGTAQYGLGEWVRFTFPSEVEVARIDFMPGYLKTSKGVDRWVQNGRLQVVDIAFDGGIHVEQAFRDKKVYQSAVMGTPVRTRSVTISIVSVYPGSAGPGWEAAEDTSVSEIHVYGYE